MNRSIRIVSTLILMSGIISCKKDSNSESNKTRLSKLIQWNSTNPAKNITTIEFTYDDQKRVVEIATFLGDSVGGEIKSAKSRSFKCFYNGNDANPYKTIGAISYYNSSTAEIFHFYSNGQLVQDSIPMPSGGTNQRTIRKYNYLADKILVQNNEQGTFNNMTKDSFLLSNNNIKESYTGIYSFQSQYSGFKMISDNKINPISKLNIATLTTTSPLFGFPGFLAPGYSQNNITEYTYGSSTGPGNFVPTGIYYFTYTYNGSNLPSECRYTSGNSTNTVKYQYID